MTTAESPNSNGRRDGAGGGAGAGCGIPGGGASGEACPSVKGAATENIRVYSLGP